MTASTGPTSAGLSATCVGETLKSPFGLRMCSPSRRIASRCAPRAMKATEYPARASTEPKYPLLRPHQTQQTLVWNSRSSSYPMTSTGDDHLKKRSINDEDRRSAFGKRSMRPPIAIAYVPVSPTTSRKNHNRICRFGTHRVRRSVNRHMLLRSLQPDAHNSPSAGFFDRLNAVDGARDSLAVAVQRVAAPGTSG
jgi:hypothetical protein